MEIWKDIEGFEGIYQVSSHGRIRHKIKGIKSFNEVNGYYKVDLYDKEKRKHIRFRVHRLVAKAFIENPNNYKEVNHIDEDKHNNRVSNLEWCSREQNLIHSIKTNKFKICKVVQCDMSGNVLKVYNSASEAERETGIPRTHICKVALGRYGFKSAGGFLWKALGE